MTNTDSPRYQVSGGPSQPVHITNNILPTAPVDAVITIARGANRIETGQLTANGTPQLLAADQPNRRSVSVVNADATNPIYLGNETLTTANGHYIAPRGSISIDTTQEVWVVAASGTPLVTWMESFDDMEP